MIAVYAAAIIQGVALVTFPAASTIFTSPSYYGLSNTAYGGMFVPQAITAIAASLLGAGLTRRWGIKRIYLLGLVANLVSMLLLLLSQFVMANQPLAYVILLLATASLGIGFGLTVPSLNTFAAAFFPQHVDRAVLDSECAVGTWAPCWRRSSSPSLLVLASGGDSLSGGRAAAGAAAVQHAPAATGRDLETAGSASAGTSDRRFRRASGSLPHSPCSTASSRR